MKINFLCRHHLSWLQQNPAAAKSVFSRSYEQGIELMEQRDCQAAASHAGCALETAQILLKSGIESVDEVIGLYSDAGVLLVYSLQQLGEYDLANNIYNGIFIELQMLLNQKGRSPEVEVAYQRWILLKNEVELQMNHSDFGFPQAVSMRVH